MDSSVWLPVVAPLMVRLYQVNAYGPTWLRIRAGGAVVHTDTVVLSEVFNRILRSRWEVAVSQAEAEARERPSLKSFRSSDDGQLALEEAAEAATDILSWSILSPEVPDRDEVQAAIDAAAGGSLDITDALIVETCRLNHLTLLTDDADFAGSGVPILTANPRLLR
ncbi:MAG: PIN domain-containing protein [Armatimonadetes bacterium]|nr:PIN domain-containing protein [Armatimonadota bacterium]